MHGPWLRFEGVCCVNITNLDYPIECFRSVRTCASTINCPAKAVVRPVYQYYLAVDWRFCSTREASRERRIHSYTRAFATDCCARAYVRAIMSGVKEQFICDMIVFLLLSSFLSNTAVQVQQAVSIQLQRNGFETVVRLLYLFVCRPFSWRPTQNTFLVDDRSAPLASSLVFRVVGTKRFGKRVPSINRSTYRRGTPSFAAMERECACKVRVGRVFSNSPPLTGACTSL